MRLYMAVTADKYELPVAIAERLVEMERMMNMPKNSLKSYISRGHTRKKARVRFVVVEVDE